MRTEELRNVTQGSTPWIQARIGKATGSRVADALSKLKSGAPAAARRKYAVELICERLLGYPLENFVTDAMRHGIDTERLAVAAYERRTEEPVEKVGICQHETIALFCASPDRLVGSRGLLEVKAPNTSTHIAWMLDGGLPPEYEPQCIAELACAPEREYLDFLSFDPRLPLRYQEFGVRLMRKDCLDRIAEVERGVVAFLGEVDAMMDGMNTLCPETIAEPQWDDATRLDLATIDEWFKEQSGGSMTHDREQI